MTESVSSRRGSKILVSVLLVTILIGGWMSWPYLWANETFGTLVETTQRHDGTPPPAEVAELYGRLTHGESTQITRPIRWRLVSKDPVERSSALYLLGSWYLIDPELEVVPVPSDADPVFDHVQRFDSSIAAAPASSDPEECRAAVYAARGLSDLTAVESELSRILATTKDTALREQVESILQR